MKFRFIFIIALATFTLFLSACNFTLAEDITPPPGYVAPPPAPTLGPLYPAQAPSIENGAAIYVEKCAPCHGQTGLGDGEQGIQLQGVTVPAFGLPEIARPASLAKWYIMVTRGNIERFMPPFESLTDQERWDVVAYAMTFHTTRDEIEKGRDLFEANCANCSTDFFQDQLKMSALSGVELARIVRQGNDEVPAFGSNLSDDDVWAVAAYLRTLAFDTAPLARPTTVPVTGTPIASDAETPSVEGTLVGTEQAEASSEATAILEEGFGTVSGSIENKTGADLSSELKITLRGFDQGSDPNATPQEVLSLGGTVNAEGTFAFDHVEMPASRIFMAQVKHDGITLQSGFAIVEEGASKLTLPPITLYGTTNDISALVMDDARIFFDYAENDIRVFAVYSFRNLTDKIVVAQLKDGVEIPFIKSPEGAEALGYEPMQDSQPFISTESGLAFLPNEQPYGLIAFSTLPKDIRVEVAQPFELSVTSLTVFLPEGVKAEGTQMTDHGLQAIEGFNFQMYAAGNLGAGDTLTFTLSGLPGETLAPTPETNSNQNLLIGAGALGMALILAGGWIYLRDRNRVEEDAGDTFKSPEDVMDAIIALDDLHRAKKIPNDAYQKRRAQLKEILKEML